MKNSEVTEQICIRWLKKYSDDLKKAPDELARTIFFYLFLR
jgi:hypothetical protein